MNKKASLKDAFVKSMEGAGNQQPRDTATQPAVYPSSQQAGPSTYAFPATHSAGAAGVQPAVEHPVSQHAGSLYTQQASSPPIHINKKKATFNLDASLHQRLKIAAAMHSREMVDIVQDALQAYLPVLDKKVG